MNLITDKQITWNNGAFPSQYDTVKVVQGEGKWYQHNDETFATKNTLRRALSSEYGGAWIEEKDGKRRYFIDESVWFKRSIREVSKEEFAQKLDTPPTWQKVLGLGLGILALAPGVSEWARLVPKEAGLGLLAMQQKSIPLLGALGYSSIVDAQAVGAEFQVNTFTLGIQQNPSVASLANGEFIVVWQSDGQDGNGYGIFGQRFDSNNIPIGTEFQINTYTTSNQIFPSISSFSDGGFVVVWQSNGQDGAGFGVFAQKYDVNGSRIGGEFQVNTYTASNQQRPSIAALGDGRFMIVWESNGQDLTGLGIYGQRFASNGTALGPEFRINTYTLLDQLHPSIASLNGNGFIVAWQSFAQGLSVNSIFGRKYNANGATIGGEFQINTYSLLASENARIATLTDGGVVVVWANNGRDGSSWGIFGQRYDANGTAIGGEFQINTYSANSQMDPSIDGLNDGGFVITWDSNGQDGNLTGIFGKRYSVNGSAMGSELQINTYTANRQHQSKVAALSDGGFVVTWTSDGQDGNFSGIFGQRYPIGTAIESSSHIQSNSTFFPILWSSPSSIRSLTSSHTLSSASVVGTSTHFSGSTHGSEFTTAASTLFYSSGLISTSIVDIVYGQAYSIIQNGQIIGTFTISGGTGLFDRNNLSELDVEFNLNYEPIEGENIILFTVPQGQEDIAGNLQLSGITHGCLGVQQEIHANSEGDNNYQLIFEDFGICITLAPKVFTSAIAMTTN